MSPGGFEDKFFLLLGMTSLTVCISLPVVDRGFIRIIDFRIRNKEDVVQISYRERKG